MLRFAIFLSCLTLVACNPKVEKVENVDDYGHKEVYQRDKEDFGREGLYERFNEQGVKVEEAIYKNDTLDGYRILYAENGDTQVVETHVEGRFEGPFKSYYENGQIEIEGQYAYNEMDGSWKRYYKNGQLMEDVTFRENTENGPFTEYHENGSLKAEGTYINGDGEHGLLKLYDETGELERTMNCDHGVCRTMWSKENDKNRTTDE